MHVHRRSVTVPKVERFTRSKQVFCWGLMLAATAAPALAEKLHFTYLWHLEQPIYWPDRQVPPPDRYEVAWPSIVRKDGGAAHPANDLREIFGKDDRVAVYQYRVRDAINLILGYPEAGAQVSYSGGLIENVRSLGLAGQLGYTASWNVPMRQARGWLIAGTPRTRCDIVVFPFHHPLLPLCDDSAVRRSIQLYKAAYADAWGSSPEMSRGLFPPEMAFSTRLIRVLAEEGIDWVFVSGEKLSRACADFPVVLGSGGVNCDPPNRADQVNPAQGNYYRVSISRGCAPAEAVPLAFTPHRARHIDPQTGQAYSVIVVPCAQALGWEDGYAPMGLGHFHNLQAFNNPARPMLVVLAHDGDNAWGGGYSYYMEAVPNLVAAAQGAGYTAGVVGKYLADHPVPAGDFVHVEDGAWVNADGDFGSPIMLNWNWPPVRADGRIDIPGGWAEDERNWAVITAAQNRVDTAEQIAGGVGIAGILSPDASATAAERAWHYFLAALNSGYMYYGTSLDMEVKPTIACNEACRLAGAVIGDGSADATAPTVWIPQRHPWNPGGLNFGPQYGYRTSLDGGDFWIWTFAHDVSGIAGVTLRYRLDADGVNPLESFQNETYAGGPEVGSWQSLPMTRRVFPAGNVYNDPNIDFFELPAYIADQYHVQVTGLRSVLIDYYVEAVDTRGCTRRSPIQHVWIGDGSGGGTDPVVEVAPDPPQAGQNATIRYNPAGRPLAGAGAVYAHYGFNAWNPVISPDPAMTFNAPAGVWQVTVPVSSSATQLDVVFHNGAGTWDNNGGQDWHFEVSGGQTPDRWVMDGQPDAEAFAVSANGGMTLYAGLKGDVLYVACNDAGEGNDHFIFLARTPGAMRSAPWAKAGQVAGWDAFLADENDNGYCAWFDATGASQAFTGPNGGVLEGTLNLREEFGVLPACVHLAVGVYATADSGALRPAYQVPASVNGNGHLEDLEYLSVNLCTVGPAAPAADLDDDCDVDQADLDIFLACFTGPGGAPGGNCPPGADADFDNDGDVDQVDFGLAQRCVGAPMEMAGGACLP